MFVCKRLHIVYLHIRTLLMLQLAIINGPNLNLLGLREPHIYGSQKFEDYLALLKKQFPNVELTSFQSNVEGELINYLHECMGKMDGVIFNPGAYTHTSIALADAVSAISIPVVEVHISNVLAREDYRKSSFIASKCVGSISGLGMQGYALAVQYFTGAESLKG
jgi:3-dehydroquinate dehydratase II